MNLSIQQELALKRPYTEQDAIDKQHVGADGHHMSGRWISTDVQVHIVFTVSIPEVGRPFWHVSMGVKVRDVGSMPMAGLEKAMRRRLRDIGQELLRGVGVPPDADHWEIGDKALHLMRSLTDEEIAEMPRV